MTATLAQKAEPPTAIVGIYHVAPGKHLDFLKWHVARDAAAREDGFLGGLEFRTLISSHTGTKAVGPVTAAQLVGMAEK